MDTFWKNTTEALKNFTDALVCNKCRREPINAVTFTNCGHFFCKKCVENDTTCSKCNTPVQPVEIYSDHMINSLTSYCNSIAKIIGKRNFQNATTDALDVSEVSLVPSKINSEASNRKRVPQKNINKKNGKGETILHRACLKNDIEYVKLLLAAGADPNTKDNAGWTPLQEVVDAGSTSICKILLEFGALPNTPGRENRTALHEAVINKRLDEVKLLLQYHAKSDVYDKQGKRPIDYCEPSKDTMSRKILNLLKKGNRMNENSISFNSTLEQSFVVSHSSNTFTIFAPNLREENKKRLSEVAAKHKIKVVSMYQALVTHVVVEANRQNIVQLSYDVMMAILRGNWLLNSEWFQIAMDVDDISTMDFELFEISGAPVIGTPKAARENEQNQNPGLFDNCYFYFALQPKNTYCVNEMELTRDRLERLVENGKGTILKRQPDPEEVTQREIIIPFHIANNSSHPLYKCTHYIIYVPGKDEPRAKYNMPHIKSLPLLWLIECIEKFTLVDPSYLGLL
ncbi:BRCA1-associated RING domain protein 1 [Lasioglossum baleicum]|uniref:BRCA1-associated RING domain protein 1 n=1 Tax=Lasioglossum baleicum TaxID=434251 RepID=UPI003FCE9990